MRKLIYILVALLLFIGTIGVTFNMHFCSGKLVSTSFISKQAKCCGENCKTCTDTSLIYKLKENYSKVNAVVISHEVTISTIIFSVVPAKIFSENFINAFECINPPPLIRENIYIIIRVFRI